ncbi:MAG: 50S ribosomal protein L17 [Chloroflexi bacterium]|nr:50S ribosomal protein L17 [Chloroflexota bacterium]MBI4198765.1 50S ribosomal protein L17 [Chloroflexota bacterium]
MRHRMDGRRFNRPGDQRKALYRTLIRSLLLQEHIQTTEAKAKEVQGMTERMITYGKKGTLHDRRIALTHLPDKDVVAKVFDDLSKRYAQRSGGYTRVLKLGPRTGDGARMAIVELV